MDSASSWSQLADFILVLGRLLLSLIFLHEGSVLASDISTTVDTFAKLGLAAPVAFAVIALQLAAGLSVAAGFLSRLGALALAFFCLATALLFHTNFDSQNELLHFEKDLAIAGGMFVLVASGAGSISIDSLLRKRGSSLHPWLRAMM
ncbi:MULTISPECIES: DoxX family protein [unclassified Rhizobium]|uniref:DoxX family protein n=1 Tax=unclassified Rhizobium TaxID=2613769 RepID=UPI0007E9F1B1|nr:MULTISPECIES: DoxX family protein [unclassified Rhizobium]ANK87316.1 DoxX family protein [Rhizobium sp. N731]ANL17562.1 DoxX family protein [Rhizobium sp. N1314]